ncbi:helix-turn-helix domain-containing protein [Paenibacillus gallinarum]|uniref:Helix-turn-helix domain-containing protein n=1 Tax=Paenibacillus gallinarum TaxID=2762232 RepID=A0ABR8SYP7_9BACL|nr:helix-turn-helix domain-containing protein [Paenibacillus gallinarum]MBD7968547.1 helix-turn-helix domain-containing protein [Paenibacillus gallinarum]
MAPQYRTVNYTATRYGDILSGHFNEDDTYSHSRPKGMGDWLMVYTLEGEGYFHTPEGCKHIHAGELGLLRADTPHEYGTVEGCRWNFIWVHFHKLMEISYLPQEEFLIVPIPDGYTQQRVTDGLEHILYHARERSDYWYALCENTIREIILLLAQQLHRKHDPRIILTLQNLSHSMNNEIRIQDLADAAGLSSSRLSHLFKEEMGESMIEHVNRMRIKQAAIYMEHMGRTATEAAHDVGFNNYNHFANLFRRMIGVSPAKFRKDKG